MAAGREHCVAFRAPSRPGRAISVYCTSPLARHGMPERHANDRKGEGHNLVPHIHALCELARCVLRYPGIQVDNLVVPRTYSVQQPRPFVVSGASHLDHIDLQFPIAPAPQHPVPPPVQERGDVDDGRPPEPAHLPPAWFWPELPASQAPSAQRSSDMAQCFDAELPPPAGQCHHVCDSVTL